MLQFASYGRRWQLGYYRPISASSISVFIAAAWEKGDGEKRRHGFKAEMCYFILDLPGKKKKKFKLTGSSR